MDIKFAENLKAALATHKMTQQRFAERLGTTQQTISRWLQGINEPDFSTLMRICEILDETPNSLLGFKE